MSAKKTKQNKLNVNRDILYQMVLKTLSSRKALLQVRNWNSKFKTKITDVPMFLTFLPRLSSFRL